MYIVWERPPGSRYEQPICFDLTQEQAQSIVDECPKGYERSAELSPKEINLWLEMQKEVLK